MIRILDLVGRPVLTIDEGATAGKVNGVLVNAVTGEVSALIVAISDVFEAPRAVPVALVQGVGDDAVMIENSSSMVTFDQSPQLRAMGRLDSQIRGLPVITATGKSLGRVTDLLVDMASGKVEAYEVQGGAGAAASGIAGTAGTAGTAAMCASTDSGRGLLPAQRVATIGRDAIIASADAKIEAAAKGDKK